MSELTAYEIDALRLLNGDMPGPAFFQSCVGTAHADAENKLLRLGYVTDPVNLWVTEKGKKYLGELDGTVERR